MLHERLCFAHFSAKGEQLFDIEPITIASGFWHRGVHDCRSSLLFPPSERPGTVFDLGTDLRFHFPDGNNEGEHVSTKEHSQDLHISERVIHLIMFGVHKRPSPTHMKVETVYIAPRCESMSIS
jgi:hypothetical protein